MMEIKIVELNEKLKEEHDVEKFLFKMIKDSYNLDYVPEYHYDVVGLSEYYINPEKNNFYLALSEENKLVGTAGVRGYDKDYIIKNRNYNINTTASIYRLFVHSDYRHNKIASNMLKKIENFCKKQNYNEIYLHTQKDSYGALPFWLNRDYNIVHNTHDAMGTIHMEKVINPNILSNNQINQSEEIELTE